MDTKSLNSRIAAEQVMMAKRAYETESETAAILGLDELQEKILKAQAITNDILNRAVRVTDRMYGESLADSGGETPKASSYGMVQILHAQVGDLIGTLGYLDNEMRRISAL
jgi:hypothetical protein